MTVRSFVFVLGLAVLLPCHQASAHQKLTVISSVLEAYTHPNRESSVISSFVRGTVLRGSSKMIVDPEGTYWYKILLPNSSYGYVMVNDVSSSDLSQELKAAGIGAPQVEGDETRSSWARVLRVMGFVGMNTTLYKFFDERSKFSYGGEGELTFCVPLRSYGYFHRLLSLGGAVLSISQSTWVAASAVVRLYQESRIEPEVRLRFARGGVPSFQWVGASQWAGGSIGLNYPFSLFYKNHVAAYIEWGALTALDERSTWVWGAAGLGFHF